MSEENVEIVRRGYASLSFRDREFDPTLIDPDVEFDNTNAVFDAAVHHGHDGLRKAMAAGEMWKDQRLEPLEFIPVGEDRVVVPNRIVSVGRAL